MKKSAQELRARQFDTPQARLSRDLFERAGGGRSPFGLGGSNKYHGRRCDSCANWHLCRLELGESSASMNYCARQSRGYKAQEVIFNHQPQPTGAVKCP